MATCAGPNRRLDRRASRGKAIGLTILAVAMVALIIVGETNMRSMVALAGL